MNVYALALVLVCNFFLNHGIEAAEEFVVSDEEVGLRAESVEHTCHFNGNVTSANESNSLRLLLEFKETIGCYA